MIKSWILQFATQFERKVTDPLFALWNEHLSDLTAEQIDASCKKFMLEGGRFFPTIAEIRSGIVQAQKLAESEEIEREWGKVEKELDRWSPDLPTIPRLSAATMAAVSAAGGLAALVDMPFSDLQWAKKRFAETYRNNAALIAADPALLTPVKKLRELGGYTGYTRSDDCPHVGCEIIGPHDHGEKGPHEAKQGQL